MRYRRYSVIGMTMVAICVFVIYVALLFLAVAGAAYCWAEGSYGAVILCVFSAIFLIGLGLSYVGV